MTTIHEMRRARRRLVVALHRELFRPLLLPFLLWLSLQPFMNWLGIWLTWRKVIMLGLALGLLLAATRA